MRDLARENQILRELVTTLATVVQELFNNLPPEYQRLPNAQRAMEVTSKIRKGLETLEIEDDDDD